MTALAGVQTAGDAAPMTWGYVLTAIAFVLVLGAFMALPAYLDSSFHRRGVARLRAYRLAHQRGVARVQRH